MDRWVRKGGAHQTSARSEQQQKAESTETTTCETGPYNPHRQQKGQAPRRERCRDSSALT